MLKKGTDTRAWCQVTPRIDAELVGECTQADCDGQFLFDDGATLYSRNGSGIQMYHNANPGEFNGCMMVWKYQGNPVIDDEKDCSKNQYTVCKCSP